MRKGGKERDEIHNGLGGGRAEGESLSISPAIELIL